MEMMVMIGMVLMFVFGIIVGEGKPQKTIDRFKDKPVCVESKVGAETIKNCYELKKVESK